MQSHWKKGWSTTHKRKYYQHMHKHKVSVFKPTAKEKARKTKMGCDQFVALCSHADKALAMQGGVIPFLKSYVACGYMKEHHDGLREIPGVEEYVGEDEVASVETKIVEAREDDGATTTALTLLQRGECTRGEVGVLFCAAMRALAKGRGKTLKSWHIIEMYTRIVVGKWKPAGVGEADFACLFV